MPPPAQMRKAQATKEKPAAGQDNSESGGDVEMPDHSTEISPPNTQDQPMTSYPLGPDDWASAFAPVSPEIVRAHANLPGVPIDPSTQKITGSAAQFQSDFKESMSALGARFSRTSQNSPSATPRASGVPSTMDSLNNRESNTRDHIEFRMGLTELQYWNFQSTEALRVSVSFVESFLSELEWMQAQLVSHHENLIRSRRWTEKALDAINRASYIQSLRTDVVSSIEDGEAQGRQGFRRSG